MRKALLMAPLFVAFLALVFASPVNAVTVTVDTGDWDEEDFTPRDTFFPGETFWVHIHSSEDAEGYIELLYDEEDPIDGTDIELELTSDEDIYIDYEIPSDTPLDTYYVYVELEGIDPFWLSFTVIEFFVIPELPMGTLMAVVIPFVAMSGIAKAKRLQLNL